jgi:hypothetical protein
METFGRRECGVGRPTHNERATTGLDRVGTREGRGEDRWSRRGASQGSASMRVKNDSRPFYFAPDIRVVFDHRFTLKDSFKTGFGLGLGWYLAVVLITLALLLLFRILIEIGIVGPRPPVRNLHSNLINRDS